MVEFLCIADIHGGREAVLKLQRYAEDNSFENVLILGDFPGHGAFGDRERSLGEVRFVLDLLCDFRVLAIPGNCDSLEVLSVFDEYGVNLHEKSFVFDDTTLIGVGGSAPTPFDTPFEFDENILYGKLERQLKEAETEKIVLAVHGPPIDTVCDLTGSGVHVGSRAVRDAALKFQPDIILSSHIHESGGSMDALGRTRVVNIGPLYNKLFGILQLNGDITINLCEL